MSSVQEYALTTDLSKRVSNWEDKILPEIEEEVNPTILCLSDSSLDR